MEGRLYLRLLRRNWFLIIVTTVIAFALGVLAYQTATPSYRTEFSFLVEASQGSSPSQAYQGDLLAQARAPVYTQLVTSDPVIGRVQDATNSPQSLEDLKAQFSAGLEPGSTLIEVSVDAETADDSIALANAMADVYPTYVGGLNTTIDPATSVRVLNEPSSSKQVAPLRSRYAAVAVLLALFLAIVAIAIRESTNRKVRDADDVRGVVPKNVVVAAIPRGGPAFPTRLSPIVADAATHHRVLLAVDAGHPDPSYLVDVCRNIGDSQPVVLADLATGTVTPVGLASSLLSRERAGTDLYADIENLRRESFVVLALGRPTANGVVQVPKVKNAQSLLVIQKGRVAKSEISALVDVLTITGAPVVAVLLASRRPRRKN